MIIYLLNTFYYTAHPCPLLKAQPEWDKQKNRHSNIIMDLFVFILQEISTSVLIWTE